ncbi:MAG: hypothetical protein L0216_02985 [Planctomycetales bacterium]|nr:hypothetical protein [Planctomycetales bacterium]
MKALAIGIVVIAAAVLGWALWSPPAGLAPPSTTAESPAPVRAEGPKKPIPPPPPPPSPRTAAAAPAGVPPPDPDSATTAPAAASSSAPGPFPEEILAVPRRDGGGRHGRLPPHADRPVLLRAGEKVPEDVQLKCGLTREETTAVEEELVREREDLTPRLRKFVLENLKDATEAGVSGRTADELLERLAEASQREMALLMTQHDSQKLREDRTPLEAIADPDGLLAKWALLMHEVRRETHRRLRERIRPEAYREVTKVHLYEGSFAVRAQNLFAVEFGRDPAR